MSKFYSDVPTTIVMSCVEPKRSLCLSLSVCLSFFLSLPLPLSLRLFLSLYVSLHAAVLIFKVPASSLGGSDATLRTIVDKGACTQGHKMQEAVEAVTGCRVSKTRPGN